MWDINAKYEPLGYKLLEEMLITLNRQSSLELVFRVNMIPCGLVVRIRRSHRRGRGSIPRMGIPLDFLG